MRAAADERERSRATLDARSSSAANPAPACGRREHGAVECGVPPAVHLRDSPARQSLYLGSVQLPQTQGKVQSAILPLSSARYGLQASALIASLVCQTTSNWPSGLDLADHHRLRQVMVGVHDRDEAARRLHLLAVHRLPHRVDIGGAGLLDRLRPHLEADVVRLHRVVGHALGVLDEVVPLLDEGVVRRVLHRLEVVPGGEMADQVLGVDAGQLFLADREGDDRDVGRLDAGIGQLLVERARWRRR